MEQLLTPTDLSALCGVPLATIYRWNHYGTGPKSLKVGRHIRYRASDVEKWLDDQQTSQRPAV